MSEEYEHLEGKLVMDSNGCTLPVIAIDYSVGITLDSGYVYTCINGELSPHKTTPNYDEMFKWLVDSIEYGYIDLDIGMSIWKNTPTTETDGTVDCAYSV